ncbi:MAG: biotin--[acetyl-CoA-carboxylase] ligase [Acidimicrobiia bacterium]|nr:biotin--[acetyl-CoA-carboxylase] ligase [Acidimicrobiia bacterium]
MATPYVTIVADEVTSTQDVAARELENSTQPVLIVASRQSAGRGRSGSEWWQAPRAVAASLAFRNDAVPVPASFTLAVGLAVHEAIATEAGVAVMLKWPNDIELAVGAAPGGKVGGVLVERDAARTVVGCGLNLWWPQPPSGAAGLVAEDPGEALGERISRRWAQLLLAMGGAWNRAAYREVCSTLGERVTWEPTGEGTAVDVDEDGGLIVATETGRVTLRSGEVATVRRV